EWPTKRMLRAETGFTDLNDSCLGDDVRLDHAAQLWRDLRLAAEPFAKTESRLLQQHAQAVDRAVAALLRLREKRRLQRDVDDVVDHGALPERPEIDLQRVLALHAERGAVHEHVGLRQQFRQVIPPMSARTEALRQLLRARDGAIHDVHFDAALSERIDRRAAGAAGPEDHHVAAWHVPAGRAIVEVGDEA